MSEQLKRLAQIYKIKSKILGKTCLRRARIYCTGKPIDIFLSAVRLKVEFVKDVGTKYRKYIYLKVWPFLSLETALQGYIQDVNLHV